ncbi:MAG: flavin reductase family protein [Halobacteriales archaeon]|nr:flavin reductase family protein [Halobacteriales archaeon]
MEFSPSEQPDALYRTMTSLVVPRPIAWISTVDGDGHPNLAPYSYFNAVSSRPPVVMFSGGIRDGEPKDTPTNALETGEFVTNLVTQDVIEAMDKTSASVEGDEFEFAGVTPEPARTVTPARVAEAHAQFECTVRDSMTVGSSTLVLGDVEHIHVDEALLTDGKVDTRKVDAVGRLGGSYYTGIDILEFERTY